MADEPLSNESIRHLEMIQAVISRMASNSFLLKGWTVTVVAALFAITAGGGVHRLVLIALAPAVAFWLLDAYYLHQERLYRALYDAVRQRDPSIAAFSMNTRPLSRDQPSWFRTVWSRTILGFHLPILVVIVAACIYLSQGEC